MKSVLEKRETYSDPENTDPGSDKNKNGPKNGQSRNEYGSPTYNKQIHLFPFRLHAPKCFSIFCQMFF